MIFRATVGTYSIHGAQGVYIYDIYIYIRYIYIYCIYFKSFIHIQSLKKSSVTHRILAVNLSTQHRIRGFWSDVVAGGTNKTSNSRRRTIGEKGTHILKVGNHYQAAMITANSFKVHIKYGKNMWLVLGGLLQFWVCHIIAACESLCSAQEQVIVCTPDVRYFPRQAGGFRDLSCLYRWHLMSSCSFNLILLNSQDTGNTSPWNVPQCRAKQRWSNGRWVNPTSIRCEDSMISPWFIH